MKKFLALLLALVMTMSLVTVGASAKTAFTDDKDITEVEAVEVLSAMGVIAGYADGSFKPQANLTRGAGAKFVAYLMLGQKNADGLKATGTLFEDVAADYVLAPYIEWCAKMGIVDGYGNGKFGPKNLLTQAAFGKMLLTALGYDSAKEGYTGAGWQKAVYADGIAAGVYGDDGEIFAACNRETAAAMALGALTATMVEYGKTVKFSPSVVDYTLVTENGAVAVYGDKRDTDGNGLQLWETYKDLTYAKVNDIFGRPGHEWAYGDDFDKFYMDEAVLEYTEATNTCDILVDLGYAKTSTKGITLKDYYIDGAKQTTGMNWVSANKVSHGANCSAKLGGQGALLQVFEKENADGTTVYTFTVINTYLAEVDTVKTVKHGGDAQKDEAKLIVYGVVGYKTITVDPDLLAEDDMILVNYVEDIDNYAVICDDDYAVKGATAKTEYVRLLGAADSKDGKLTGASDTETRIDKVAYKDAAKFFDGWTTAKLAANKGEEYTFYFDQYGNVIGCEDVDTVTKYVVVDTAWREIIKGVDTAFADLYGFDAAAAVEKAPVAANKVANVAVDTLDKNNTGLYDGIYSYTLNDDDEYVLVAAGPTYAAEAFHYTGNPMWRMWNVMNHTDTYAQTTLSYNADNATITVDNQNWKQTRTFFGTYVLTEDTTITGGDASIKMNKNTTVLVKDLDGEYKAFTGTTLPKLSSFATVAVVNFADSSDDHDYAKLVYITDAVYTSDSVTGYVFAKTFTEFDWDDGYENVTVWTGDKTVVVKVDADDFRTVMGTKRGGFMKFTNKVTEDGDVVLKAERADNAKYKDDEVKAVSGDVVTLAGKGNVVISDKVALYEVDFDDEEVTAITYAELVALNNDGALDCTYVLNDSGDVTEIYFGEATAK